MCTTRSDAQKLSVIPAQYIYGFHTQHLTILLCHCCAFCSVTSITVSCPCLQKGLWFPVLKSAVVYCDNSVKHSAFGPLVAGSTTTRPLCLLVPEWPDSSGTFTSYGRVHAERLKSVLCVVP